MKNTDSNKINPKERFFVSLFKNLQNTASSISPANLATAGVFSALAACADSDPVQVGKIGGGDTGTGGGGDPDTGTGGGDPDGLSVYSVGALADSLHDYADGEVAKLPGINSGIDLSTDVTITLSDSATSMKEFEFISIPGAGDKGFRLLYGIGTTDAISFGVSIESSNNGGGKQLHGSLDTNSVDELLAVSVIPYQSVRVIWDFTDNATGTNGLDYVNNTFQGAELNRLSVVNSAATEVFSEVSAAEIAGEPALFLGNLLHDISKGVLYVVWDTDSYKNQVNAIVDLVDFDTGTAQEKSAIASKVLAIYGSVSGHWIGQYSVGLPKIDNDNNEDLVVVGRETSSPISKNGTVYIMWDIASQRANGTGEITLPASPVVTDGMLTIFGADTKENLGSAKQFLDLDGDNVIDIFLAGKAGASNDVKGYIIWGAEILDSNQQGMSGFITLADKLTDGSIKAFTSAGVSSGSGDEKFSSAGLWFDTPDIGTIKDNFFFLDLNNDGIKDALSLNANTDGSYSWWAMTAGENHFTGTSAADYSFGATASGSKTVSELLNDYGIMLNDYAKQNINPSEDGFDDLIEREAMPADHEKAGLHRAWLGTSDGSFDVTADADAYARLADTSGLDGSDSFEGSVADFQLVDIA